MRSTVLKIFLCLAALCCCLAASPAFPAQKPVIYFGVNLRYDPIKMYERYQPVMDYLSRATPYTFKLKISHGYEEGVKDLEQGKVQIASLGDGAVIGVMLRHLAVPIVKPLNADGKPLFQGYIVVAQRSSIKSVSDLKGKRIALGYCHSLTGNLLPRQMLRENGIKETDLAALDNLRNHTTVTKAVIKGEYDAGAVKDVVARRYQNRGLRIIAASRQRPSVPLVARKGCSPELIRTVSKALLELDYRTPAHRKILKTWDDEYEYGFAPAKLSDYQDIMNQYRSLPEGCATRCHR